MLCHDPHAWALTEFGRARLGDTRRTRRLVSLAARAAEHPNGRLTAVLASPPERQAAYRLLESHRLPPSEVARASYRACVERCSGLPFVFVALDGTSLTLTDRARTKGFGRLGTPPSRARGLKVMNALAVREDGLPLGLCGQTYWARGAEVTKHKRHTRAAQAKETGRWLEVLAEAQALFGEAAQGCRPWFQLDRGGDAWPVLLEGLTAGCWLTVRSAWNRKLLRPEGRLWEALEAAPLLGRYTLSVPAGPQRAAREAVMELRARRVTLLLRDKSTKRRHEAQLWAVLAQELEPPPGEARLMWRLLTSRPVEGFVDACEVVYGYGPLLSGGGAAQAVEERPV